MGFARGLWGTSGTAGGVVGEYDGALLPIQERAVLEGRVLPGQSIAGRCPTGSGKTFIGEMATAHAASRGRPTFCLVPTRALEEAKFGQFARSYGALGTRSSGCVTKTWPRAWGACSQRSDTRGVPVGRPAENPGCVGRTRSDERRSATTLWRIAGEPGVPNSPCDASPQQPEAAGGSQQSGRLGRARRCRTPIVRHPSSGEPRVPRPRYSDWKWSRHARLDAPTGPPPSSWQLRQPACLRPRLQTAAPSRPPVEIRRACVRGAASPPSPHRLWRRPSSACLLPAALSALWPGRCRRSRTATSSSVLPKHPPSRHQQAQPSAPDPATAHGGRMAAFTRRPAHTARALRRSIDAAG